MEIIIIALNELYKERKTKAQGRSRWHLHKAVHLYDFTMSAKIISVSPFLYFSLSISLSFPPSPLNSITSMKYEISVHLKIKPEIAPLYSESQSIFADFLCINSKFWNGVLGWGEGEHPMEVN